LKQYALAIYFKDFGLKEESGYLMDVARTDLMFRAGELYLAGAEGEELRLGDTCRTDWIGRWDTSASPLGSPSAAGDSTLASDVSGWATDYCRIRTDPERPEWPSAIGVTHRGGKALALQAALLTRGGSRLVLDLGEIRGGVRWIELMKTLAEQNLGAGDLESATLLITNLDPHARAEYEVLVRR
jgi:hypothetical protein